MSHQQIRESAIWVLLQKIKNKTFEELLQRFPQASFVETEKELHVKAVNFVCVDTDDEKQIKLHLKGTDFQLKVWEALLKIPLGNLTTYGAIAESNRCHKHQGQWGRLLVATLLPF